MHLQKKKTLKEDGRFLIYYHFPETATEEETKVFEEIVSIEQQAVAPDTDTAPNASPSLSSDSSTAPEVSHV